MSTSRAMDRRFIKVAEFCADLGIARSTFDEWRAKGTGPHCVKLPNGQLRIKQSEYERWINSREDEAA